MNRKNKKQKGKRVGRQWQEFEKKVLPIDTPPIQRLEMKKAFYAGAVALLIDLRDAMTEDVSEEDGVVIFESIEQECLEFFESLQPKNNN